MTQQEILKKITEVFGNAAGISPEDIRTDSKLMEDFDLSSLEIMIIVSELEGEFNIRFTERELFQLITVADIAQSIEKKLR